jgi:uncharacterized membrane protein YoaK (UPF0700 family)
VLSNTRQTGMWLSLGLAFVGGYGDAASFVLVKTFTGHVTGNLVLGAIAVAAHQWRVALEHLSAIVTFVMGICVSAMIVRPLKAWSSWPLLPTVMGWEVTLMAVASLLLSSLLSSHVAHRVEIFVILVSLALGLQDGAFRRIGGVSVHTTYLTGMITSRTSTEVEQYASEVNPAVVRVSDPKSAFSQESGSPLSWAPRDVLVHGVTLSILCVISYWLITHMPARAFSISRDDDLLGGMWAVVATAFVYRYGYEESVGAALSRMGATTLSFGLCFIYLLFFPFHLWGLAILIGVGAVAMSLLSRRDDVITTVSQLRS